MKLQLISLLVTLVSNEALYSSGLEVNNFEPDMAVLQAYNGESPTDKIIEKRSYDFGLWGLGGLGWPLQGHGWGHGLSFGHGIWGGGWGGTGLGNAGLGGTGLGWYGGWYPSLPSIHGGYGLSGWHHRR